MAFILNIFILMIYVVICCVIDDIPCHHWLQWVQEVQQVQADPTERQRRRHQNLELS